MKYNGKNKPLICMMTQSTCYKGTHKMKPLGVLWHSTGANNPTIKRYVQPDDNVKDRQTLLNKIGINQYGNDWNHIYHEAGLNAWIGKLADGTVSTVQTMPWDFAPWGCGSGVNGSCNERWVQFEICEDGLTDKTYFESVYKEACELTAYLCKMYGINPNGTVTYNGVTVPTILCHQDSYRLGLGCNHSDVYPWFNKFGKTMQNVRDDVQKLLTPPVSADGTKGEVCGYNRSRTTNELIVFNEGGYATTNPYGYEVAISKSGLAQADPVYGKGHMAIPSGGMVLSGHGKAGEWLFANIKKGYAVKIDNGKVVATKPTKKEVKVNMADITNINGSRGENALVLITDGRATTGFNQYGTDVIVNSSGKITLCEYGKANRAIPKGCICLSGHGTMSKFLLDNCKVGTKLQVG